MSKEKLKDMRTIKFRGLKDDISDCTFKHGMLCNNVLGEYAIQTANSQKTNTVHTVIPNTIGQFTGLKDKNGVDIYEGDLVKNVGTPKLKTVVYHDQAFYLREGNAHTRLSKLNFDGEIIGNIHEHQHLLK